MQLADFKAIIVSASPGATRYKGAGTGNYTVWAEYKANRLIADDTENTRSWLVQVDRFTKTENDPIADAITNALNANDIQFQQLVDYEQDTGYIHHIWTCEVV